MRRVSEEMKATSTELYRLALVVRSYRSLLRDSLFRDESKRLADSAEKLEVVANSLLVRE